MEGNKDVRILFTSVGRRVELMQAFHNAADKLKIHVTIFGADITDTAPALYFCNETRLVCRINDPNYIPQLLKICEEDSIDCVIPTIDTDLMLLAESKQKFEDIGAKVLIASPEKVKICRDKNYTADYFMSVGLKSIVPDNSVEKFEMKLNKGEVSFPVFIKPKDGSSSIDAYKVSGLDDLKVYADKIGDYVIQPFINGREYTIDILCDYEGNPVFITPRERLAVRSGEVLKTQIFQDEVMIESMKNLLLDFKPSGPITVQLIREKTTGDDYYIEINPRFGGGAPLSMKAGADSAMAIIKMLNGEKLQYIETAAEDGAIYSRFDQSICVSSVKKHKYEAVIFDLDDTLFSEKEYVRSGYHAIASLLPQVENAEEKLWNAFLSGKPAIDTVLNDENIYSEDLAKKCLNAYRLHKPSIHLYDAVPDIFSQLKNKGIKIGIITDGRPEGQHNKIQALGLGTMVDEIIITDELGGIDFRKPDDISFRIMQKKMNVPFESMTYIGDNLNKDFGAPQKLGMGCIWFRNPDGIYYSEDNTSGLDCIDCLNDFMTSICQ